MRREPAILLAILCLAGRPADLAAAPRPNVLLIYSDDHGWADLGAEGVDQDIRTPNLDRLAADGVRFARGYVTAPQCVPSRAGVLTGRYQQRFGVEQNGQGPLPLEERTIAERLKAAGYRTGMVGKWHLDLVATRRAADGFRAETNFMPHAQGFEEYWRGEMNRYVASHDLQGRPLADAPRLVSDSRFRIVVQTEAALSFLDRRVAKPEAPWFLYLAWFAPHVPLESPEPWFSRTPAALPLERRQALAMIAAMDDGLGRLRGKLRAMGAETNTLIFFIGDNGAPVRKGAWNGSRNAPLAGEKGMLADGGIRTPFVAAWPGAIPGGQVFPHPVISLDVAATAVAAAGLPRDDKLDGVDLVPFLTGANKAAPHDRLYWRWGSQAAVLEMPYKLIALGDRQRLLFDVTKPEGENAARDLAGKHPDIAARLEAQLTAWCGTLQLPGMPASFDAHHEGMFADHGVLARPAAPAAPPRPGAIQDWVCRNGTIALRDGGLVITPEDRTGSSATPFLTAAALDLEGPVAATLRARAKEGGPASFSWRTAGQRDFPPEQVVRFDWPAGNTGQEIRCELPVTGRLIHLRLTPPRVEGVTIQSLQLQGAGGKGRSWRFEAPP